jgi:hypothetical protein
MHELCMFSRILSLRTVLRSSSEYVLSQLVAPLLLRVLLPADV